MPFRAGQADDGEAPEGLIDDLADWDTQVVATEATAYRHQSAPAALINAMALANFGADREAAAVADDLLQKGTQVVMIGPQETIAHDVGRRGKIVLLPRLVQLLGAPAPAGGAG